MTNLKAVLNIVSKEILGCHRVLCISQCMHKGMSISSKKKFVRTFKNEFLDQSF